MFKNKIENISTPLVNPHKYWEFNELFNELNLKFKKQKKPHDDELLAMRIYMKATLLGSPPYSSTCENLNMLICCTIISFQESPYASCAKMTRWNVNLADIDSLEVVHVWDIMQLYRSQQKPRKLKQLLILETNQNFPQAILPRTTCPWRLSYKAFELTRFWRPWTPLLADSIKMWMVEVKCQHHNVL